MAVIHELTLDGQLYVYADARIDSTGSESRPKVHFDVNYFAWNLPLLNRIFLNGSNSTFPSIAKAPTLLQRLGLSDRMDHKPGELSVDQQQRVALARVLANDPKLVLADEPTGNLYRETSHQIMNYLGEINEEGRTVVIVTHDPRAAERTKRTLRLEAGRIINGHVAEANKLVASL